MNVVAIVQARMGSTRLPRKVLANVEGRTMLGRVVERTRQASLVDRVVVATTQSPDDDPIVHECDQLEVGCFRGSEDDVLDRYHGAARANHADLVVRVTADCPLIDPQVIDRVIRGFRLERPDYASNTLMRTWPRGLDTEVVSIAALHRAWREAGEPYERVHVTPYFYRHPDRFRLAAVTCSYGLGDWRWTVDRPEDLAFVREIYRLMRNRDAFSWHDVRRLLIERPSLADLNKQVRQKELVEG